MPSNGAAGSGEPRDERNVVTWTAFGVLVIGLGIVTIQMLRHRRRFARFIRFLAALRPLDRAPRTARRDTATPVET